MRRGREADMGCDPCLYGAAAMATFLDSLGDEERHVRGGGVADAVDEDAPAVLLLLAPAVGPPQDDRVRLHPAQARSLDPVCREKGMGIDMRESDATDVVFPVWSHHIRYDFLLNRPTLTDGRLRQRYFLI